jgi:uncharacterized membrane protein YczE
MSKPFQLRRISAYGIGLLIYALGADLSTKARLGITPITSVNYIISYISAISLGTVMFFTNVLCVLIQLALLKDEFKKRQWLQIPLSLVFSIFIDLFLYLLRGVNPTNLAVRCTLFALALLLMGLGVSLVIMTDVMILPADGVATALAKKLNISPGSGKVVNDCLMVILTLIISLAALRRVEGIHIGTVVGALLIGRIAGFCIRRLKTWVNGETIE